MWIHLLALELIDGATSADAPAPAVVSRGTPGGVRKAHFLRRGPKLPWDAPEQEDAPEVVVTERKKLRRVKLPKEVIETVADAMPVAEAIVLPSYRISIPDIPVKLPDTEEEEAVLMALLL